MRKKLIKKTNPTALVKRKVRDMPVKQTKKRKIKALPCKERVFVQTYVLYWNAALSAREAGMTRKNGTDTGALLLKDPNILAAIKEETEIQSARLNISKARVTDMILETYRAAKASGKLKIELDAAMSLAKLHGLLISKQHVVVSELSNMNEAEVLELLGNAYNPKILDKVAKAIPADFIDVTPVDDNQEESK